MSRFRPRLTRIRCNATVHVVAHHPNHVVRLFAACWLALTAGACSSHTQFDHQTAQRTYDVVVYGGTAAGVTTAVQVRKEGRTVILIEPGQHIGGLTSGGLGATDIGNKAAIGGLSRTFYERIYTHYADAAAWTWQQREAYRSKRAKAGDRAMWTFEPRVAEQVLRTMLADNDVPVLFGQRLDRNKGVTKDRASITSIHLESGLAIAGRMFVDTTYEGDLMAAAGVSYTVGREANARYDETLNGVQVAKAVHHQFVVPVDPYIVAGDPASGLLPGIRATAMLSDGSQDRGVQAYCFRMCTTDVPSNRVPWTKPADYNEQLYELLFRNFEAGDMRIPWNPIWMPNRKTDTNNNFAVSTDFIGHNYHWADADYATRERLFAEHLSYQQGLLWSLANHARVPPKVRDYFQRFGMAKDEFIDHDHWPHQLYVREARRMVSDHVMTQHECQGRQTVPDAIGLAAYTMDSHHIQRHVDEHGHVRNEGDVQVGGFPPYGISYRSIRPKRDQCNNLLVPVCLSASHIAYGSIRMEPVFMVLGQSAASAACLALTTGHSVQDIDITKLQRRLLRDGQMLTWTKGAGKPGIARTSLAGIVLDNDDAKLRGDWLRSHSTAGYVGTSYLHDGNVQKGDKTATFAPALPAAGKYRIAVGYPAHANRASNVRVVIEHAKGRDIITLDQRRPPDHGALQQIGTYWCAAGKQTTVTISNAETTGYVIVDAVQFVRVE